MIRSFASSNLGKGIEGYQERGRGTCPVFFACPQKMLNLFGGVAVHAYIDISVFVQAYVYLTSISLIGGVMAENTAEKTKASQLAGKYLTFRVASEEYGLEILKVREIIGLMDITPVPRTPEFIRGVINLRGKIIPVVSLRSKFGMETIEDTEETCIIVVDVVRGRGSVQMGVVVDSVSEVLDIGGADIENAPTFGSSVDIDYILGMAKAKGSVKILLNIEKVLTDGDLEAIDDAMGMA